MKWVSALLGGPPFDPEMFLSAALLGWERGPLKPPMCSPLSTRHQGIWQRPHVNPEEPGYGELHDVQRIHSLAPSPRTTHLTLKSTLRVGKMFLYSNAPGTLVRQDPSENPTHFQNGTFGREPPSQLGLWRVAGKPTPRALAARAGVGLCKRDPSS